MPLRLPRLAGAAWRLSQFPAETGPARGGVRRGRGGGRRSLARCQFRRRRCQPGGGPRAPSASPGVTPDPVRGELPGMPGL